jgi:hypothetical protein
MSAWEPQVGASDEWYTPRYVFDALGVTFDLDVAAPPEGPRYAPCGAFLHADSLQAQWHGFVWMNPPFGGRNGMEPWLDKFFDHGNGIALGPDRTSAQWWQRAADRSSAILLTAHKVKFERPDGTIGKNPGAGVTLFASGYRARIALLSAQKVGLGSVWERAR